MFSFMWIFFVTIEIMITALFGIIRKVLLQEITT